jgi:hypothetical protein
VFYDAPENDRVELSRGILGFVDDVEARTPELLSSSEMLLTD